MSTELNLRFPNPEQVVVRFGDDETAALPFQNPLTAKDHADIRWYVETGEPMDKAGAYGIQGRAGMFVEHLAGSYTGVMGLPLFETTQLLRRFGYPL